VRISLHSSAGRWLTAGAFALAVAAAPAVTVLSTSHADSVRPVAACPAGETEDLFTDNCVPELSPNTPGGNWPTPAPVVPDNTGEITESTPGDPDSVPEIDGVPCTGGRSGGACIGLEEDAVPPVVPHSTLSSSP
jgi:hypothetical protein